MSPLRRRMIEDMQIRNLTPNTQRVYVAQVVHFACHFRKSPDRSTCLPTGSRPSYRLLSNAAAITG